MDVYAEIREERARQDAKWGQQDHGDRQHPDDHLQYIALADQWKQRNAERVAELTEAGEPAGRDCFWDGIFLEEVYEALAERDPRKLRAELIQAISVGHAWIEAIDRREADPPPQFL